MGKKLDITGQKFNRLTAIKECGRTKGGMTLWLFMCECGNELIAPGAKVKFGHTKSCGCLLHDTLMKRNLTHGKCNTPEYESWCGMKKRCYDEKCKSFPQYGGIGIKVCEEWLHSFENFLKDVGPIPTEGKRWSLGRIDNCGDYCPENCRWETDLQQARNHGLQKNNKTGYAGIKYRDTDKKRGKYCCYIATVNIAIKKTKSKSFSVAKLGKDEALRLAILWREEQVKLLEDSEAPYAASHGKKKECREHV